MSAIVFAEKRQARASLSAPFGSNIKFRGNGTDGIEGIALTRRDTVFSR